MIRKWSRDHIHLTPANGHPKDRKDYRVSIYFTITMTKIYFTITMTKIYFTITNFSGHNLKMKLSLARLAKGFGQLATVRGTTKYHISPFEQRAFAGAITKGIPNTIWRIRASILDVAPRKS